MFLIRADGNAKIGAGHLMRCLTIGTKLAELVGKTELLFLCADEQSAELVGRNGLNAVVLGTDYRDMESELPIWEKNLRLWTVGQKERQSSRIAEHEEQWGSGTAGQEERWGSGTAGRRNRPDSVETAALTGKQRGRTVILADSYYVTNRYLEGLRRFGFVALMDDMGQKKYPVDAVINYNAPAEPESYKRLYGGSGTALLIGSRYAPIRQQFLNRTYQIRDEVKSVLITTGGGDSENIAGKILRTLYDENLEFHLVVGQFNPHFQALRQLEDTHRNIHLHCNVADMAGLMTAADIAVTAGGSTIYELAALGVPFICFSYAENQEALTEYIGQREIAGFAGAYHKAPSATLEQMGILFRELARREAGRRQYHDREKSLIDGQGAARLAHALREFSFEGDFT